MNFLIADTFTASFARLSGADKAVKASVFDLQIDPTGNGLQLHRIDDSKDRHFWSARVNRDIRPILHKTGGGDLQVTLSAGQAPLPSARPDSRTGPKPFYAPYAPWRCLRSHPNVKERHPRMRDRIRFLSCFRGIHAL
jgi:hypothetical protein